MLIGLCSLYLLIIGYTQSGCSQGTSNSASEDLQLEAATHADLSTDAHCSSGK